MYPGGSMVPWRRSRGRGTWQLRPPASPPSSGRVWETSGDAGDATSAGDAGDAASAGDAGGDAASWGRTWWQTSPSSPLTQAHTLMLGTGDTAPTAASTCNTRYEVRRASVRGLLLSRCQRNFTGIFTRSFISVLIDS